MEQLNIIRSSITKYLDEISRLQQQIAEEEDKLFLCIRQEKQLLQTVTDDQISLLFKHYAA